MLTLDMLIESIYSNLIPASAAVEVKTENFTIGTSIQQVLNQDPSRLGILLLSNSTNNIHVGFDNNVTTYGGIQINATYVYFDTQSPFLAALIKNGLWAISTAAGDNLTVIHARLIEG